SLGPPQGHQAAQGQAGRLLAAADPAALSRRRAGRRHLVHRGQHQRLRPGGLGSRRPRPRLVLPHRDRGPRRHGAGVHREPRRAARADGQARVRAAGPALRRVPGRQPAGDPAPRRPRGLSSDHPRAKVRSRPVPVRRPGSLADSGRSAPLPCAIQPQILQDARLIFEKLEISVCRKLVALAGVLAVFAWPPTPAASSPASAQASGTASLAGAIEGVRSSMTGGNTVGDQLREARPRADVYRHIDTPRLIAQLKRLHVNNYLFQIWGSKSDWDDLRREFAPAAQEAGIEVWVYIAPPTECLLPYKCSYPYKTDYVAWAKAIAKLSVRYPNVTGWAIDDFSAGGNPGTFDPEYMAEITAASDAINPDLALYTTAYYD